MSCEDQSLSHSRPKEVVAHWILQSSSLSIRQSSVTVLPRYLKECTFARCVPLTDNGFLTAEFWSAMTSVFLQFIVRPNEDAASAKLSMWSCNASSESAISAQSSAYWNSCSKVVIHLDCDRRRARLKSDPFERKRIDTPEGESEKACMNIAAANMAKRVGARMHPCLTPLLYGISLVSSLSTKILTVMSRCKHFRIATNLGGHPIFFFSWWPTEHCGSQSQTLWWRRAPVGVTP